LKATILSFVWNDFDSDDRVKKKVHTFAKENKVIVYCVPKPSQYKVPFRQVSENILVRYIKTKNIYWWAFHRIVDNERFWRKQFISSDLIHDTEYIIDCNEPDTLFAGVHLLHYYKCGYKLIYDSHEYHNDNFVPYKRLLGVYSWFATKCHKHRQKKYLPFVDKVVTVSDGIKEMMVKDWGTDRPIFVLPNYSRKYVPFDFYSKNKVATFVGGWSRNGLEKIIPLLQDLDFCVQHIGNPPPKRLKRVRYLGWLPKHEFMPILERSLVGILYYDCPNKSFENSIPNKLSNYVQTGNFVVHHNDLKAVGSLVAKYGVGIGIPTVTKKNYAEVKWYLQRFMDNVFDENLGIYHELLKIAKDDLCWEHYEQDLLKFYGVCDLDEDNKYGKGYTSPSARCKKCHNYKK
jgi:hypothetical protein